MTQREKDMRAEKELARFLDLHFYKELLKEKNYSYFRRVFDIGTQMQGIDVIGKLHGTYINIDEKAQLHYINQSLPTFAFELEFLLYGQPTEGWLMNNSLKTTHYFLLWPQATTTDLSIITRDDFTYVEGILIEKAKLKQHLDDIGLEQRVLQRITSIIREQGIVGPRPTAYEGIKFFASSPQKYIEAPINIVIRKNILASLADAHYIISQQGFIRKH